MLHIYNGILVTYKKELNNSICSNMDGPRDCQTEWNQSDRERQISYVITFKNGKINVCINTKQKKTYRYWRQIYSYLKGNMRGLDKLGAWDEHAHITVYKIDNQQGCTVWHRELYSTFCENL